MIYTSYFAMIPRLKENDIIPIAICGGVPDYYNELWYRKLAPSWSIYSEYKETGNSEKYTQRYYNEILSKLRPDKVYNQLCGLCDSSNFCLICYEKPEDFCHRHLVATWFSKYGYPCQEWVDPILF